MEYGKRRLKSSDVITSNSHIKVALRQGNYPIIHSHDYFEIEIIVNGKGTMLIDSVVHEINPGSICILTPADFHYVILEENNLVWNIAFDESVPSPELLETIFSLKKNFCTVSESTLEAIMSATELLSNETNADCIRILLEYILKKTGLCDSMAEMGSPIQRALLYIQTYFRNDPTLAETAKHVGLSSSYFGTLFHSVVGDTYVEYLNKCKSNCAMRLLDLGKSVTESCFESGFGSLSGFRYIFKQTTGMTPTEYKNRTTN
jgi:AraC-like DNA-binding protein